MPDVSFEGGKYRQLSGTALREAIVGKMLDYPGREIVISGGRCELYFPNGHMLHCAHRVRFRGGSYFLLSDQICVKGWEQKGCKELYWDGHSRYLVKQVSGAAQFERVSLTPIPADMFGLEGAWPQRG